MPGPAPASALPRADKREAILDAALALFCEHTFDGTAVPLVAERANVGAGTIYRYFDSKEALVNAVYQRAKREMKRALVDEAPADATAREGFGHFWRGLWRFALEHPQAFSFLEMHHHAPYIDEESCAAGAEIHDGIHAFIRRAQRSGEVRKIDADALIAMVMGAFTGLIKASEGGLKIGPKAIAETEACVWQMVRAGRAK